MRRYNGNIDLMLTVILGAAATGILIEPTAMLVAGRSGLFGFMPGNQVLKQLFVGRRIRMRMAAGLHDMANPLLGNVVSTMFLKGMGHDYLGFRLSRSP
jgi:hypothetical protein